MSACKEHFIVHLVGRNLRIQLTKIVARVLVNLLAMALYAIARRRRTISIAWCSQRISTANIMLWLHIRSYMLLILTHRFQRRSETSSNEGAISRPVIAYTRNVCYSRVKIMYFKGGGRDRPFALLDQPLFGLWKRLSEKQ